MDKIWKYHAPLGDMTMASDGENLKGLWFDGQKYDRRTLTEHYEEEWLPVFENTIRWLDQYFAGKKPDVVIPLAPEGSDFRQEVWKILLDIPYGETTTYGAIAKELAARRGTETMSAQAVGSAVGHNPISLLIPCHRVLGSDGSLTGYAGGVEKKEKLLELERKNKI